MKKEYTTVKLDGFLVEEVAKELEEGETLTSYVREAVKYKLNRERMRESARAYAEAVEKDPELESELGDWERADLANPPRNT